MACARHSMAWHGMAWYGIVRYIQGLTPAGPGQPPGSACPHWTARWSGAAPTAAALLQGDTAGVANRQGAGSQGHGQLLDSFPHAALWMPQLTTNGRCSLSVAPNAEQILLTIVDGVRHHRWGATNERRARHGAAANKAGGKLSRPERQKIYQHGVVFVLQGTQAPPVKLPERWRQGCGCDGGGGGGGGSGGRWVALRAACSFECACVAVIDVRPPWGGAPACLDEASERRTCGSASRQPAPLLRGLERSTSSGDWTGIRLPPRCIKGADGPPAATAGR